VSTGNEGIMGCVGRADIYSRAHSSVAVDYLTLHVWAKNWGWLTEPRLGPNYDHALARTLQHTEDHILLAEQLGKPLVLEEFGIGRDNESAEPGSPTKMRDDYYDKIFRSLAASCKSDRELQGVNFWLWAGDGSGTGRPQRLDLNGVAASDTSTLEVIRQHAFQLRNR
jgi:mannan endo-1,4-beta-mannosidase